MLGRITTVIHAYELIQGVSSTIVAVEYGKHGQITVGQEHEYCLPSNLKINFDNLLWHFGW